MAHKEGTHSFAGNAKIYNAIAKFNQADCMSDTLKAEGDYYNNKIRYSTLLKHGFMHLAEHCDLRDGYLKTARGDKLEFSDEAKQIAIDQMTRGKDYATVATAAVDLKGKLWETIEEQLDLDTSQNWTIDHEEEAIKHKGRMPDPDDDDMPDMPPKLRKMLKDLLK